MADRQSFTRRGPAASPDPAARRNVASPHGTDRRTAVTVAVLVAASVAAAVATAFGDGRLPTGREWSVAGILAAVAVVGAFGTARFGPADDGSSPPWDPHTVWLMPAALLTPPLAFTGLVALSVGLSLAKRIHPLMLRVVVACITVLTTCAIHATASLVGSLFGAALLGIVLLWLIGVVVAVTAAHIFVTPTGTATWLDYRWSLVLIGCALSGMAVAAAMVTEPLFGVAAVAPLLMAAFALRWPELDRHASVDAKTGLPNARAWEDRSSELLAAAALHEIPVVVMILDIDRFKSVNDTYGHLAGDQVLVGIADTLRSQVNPGDTVGRFGGEEFVVTMFDLSATQALATAERIRAAVAAQHHRITPGAVAVGSDRSDRASGPDTHEPDTPRECRVTCTIGVASSDHFGYDFARLLRGADHALGLGKEAGRDQVRTAAAESAADRAAADASRPPTWWGVATHQNSVRRDRREQVRAGRS